MTEETTKKESYESRRQEKDAARNLSSKTRRFKKLFLWFLVIGAMAGSAFAAYKYGGNTTGTTAMIVDAVNPTDRVFGTSDSKVTLIEYGDFQCPACAQYEPIVQKVRTDYAGNIAFIYRHFPLRQHQHAKITAYASEAAGKQGKFWEMHDMIYNGQNTWANLSGDKTRVVLIKYAETIGLDLVSFEKDMDSSEIKNKVASDNDGGLKAGVNATPTFILNGKRIQPRSYDEFKDLIEQEISVVSNS
ncbi:MAG: thioredoxin domain-containing protein [Patescibacteria group bacterium]